MRIIAELTGYIPNKLIGDLSNVHFYEPHIDLVDKQLENSPTQFFSPEFQFSEKALREFERFRRGTIDLDAVLYAIDIEDFNFRNYNFFPAIGAEMYEPKK